MGLDVVCPTVLDFKQYFHSWVQVPPISVSLKKLIFYIVHSKHVTKTQKYVKIVGREPSFFHLQRPAGVLALWRNPGFNLDLVANTLELLVEAHGGDRDGGAEFLSEK